MRDQIRLLRPPGERRARILEGWEAEWTDRRAREDALPRSRDGWRERDRAGRFDGRSLRPACENWRPVRRKPRSKIEPRRASDGLS